MLKTGDRGRRTADRRPGTADGRPQTADGEPETADGRPQSNISEICVHLRPIPKSEIEQSEIFCYNGGMRTEVPFDIDRAIELVEEAVRPYPQAAMFELAERGFADPFQQLVACIISIRTRDEVSLPVAEKLLTVAPTPAGMVALTPAGIDRLISSCTFHERKAAQIHAIAQAVEQEHAGRLPCDRELLLSFAGVGPKCANLALGIACDAAFISVDIHVHRITNRWGYVQASTPEKTMVALEDKLPRRHWLDINRLLVPFGKHVCTGQFPRCSTCPLFTMCAREGVKSYR